MNWKKHCIISTALLSTLTFSITARADEPTSSFNDKQQEVDSQLKTVREQLQSKTNEAQDIKDRKKQTYQEWKDISVKLADLEIQEYQQTSDLLQAQNRLVNINEDQKTLKQKMEKRKEVLSKRLEIMQEQQGNTNLFTILVNSTSLADFFNRSVAASYIIQSDQSLIDSYEGEIEEYNELKQDARAALDEIQTLQTKVNQTKADLQAQEKMKTQYMNGLNNQYGWTMKDVQALQTQYTQLEQQQTELEEQAAAAALQAQENAQTATSRAGTVSNNSFSYTGKGSYDVRNVSNVTAENLNSVLTGQLSGYGSTYIEVGHKYGIDPAFLMAITMAETGGDSRWLRQYNNVGGFIHNGPMTFSSIEDSINYMGSLLTRLYIGDGLFTVEAIHNRYSPEGASNDPNNLNANWVKNVYLYLSKAGISV